MKRYSDSDSFTMWCPVCNQHTQQAPPNVSVRALILALGRFGIVAAAEVKSLEKRWAKHRKENNLDRNGKPNPALSTGSSKPLRGRLILPDIRFYPIIIVVTVKALLSFTEGESFMNDWYQRMVATLQLNGKGERTQQAYTRSVRMLSQFYDKTPDLITEQELQDYFLHRKNVNHWSPKTMRICYCGIRFFYVNVLERNWHILSNPARPKRTPPARRLKRRRSPKHSWPTSKPSTTTSIFPPSTPAACDFTKASISKSPISIASA